MNPSQDPKPQPFPPELQAILDIYVTSPEPIEIPLPGSGIVLHLAPISTSEVRRELDKDADIYVEKMPKDRNSSAFAKFADGGYVPVSEEDIRLSYEIHRRCLDPRIPMKFAFELHRAPELMAYIDRFLAQADKTMVGMLQKKALEAAKGKSETQAPSSPDDSRSAAATSPGDSPAT